MATKRRSKNEDDEEDDDDRPRRKSKNEDDDDDDSPRKRRKSRDEEDEDDDRPRKRRKSRDDEDGEDDRPRKRRKQPDEEDVEEIEELDDLPDDDPEKTYEEQLREITRKIAKRRKQLTSLSEGLDTFRKQIQYVMLGVVVAAGLIGGVQILGRLLFEADFTKTITIWTAFLLIAVVIYIPIVAVSAVNKCKEGPDSDTDGILTGILIVSLTSYVLIPLTSVLEAVYFGKIARYLKDKEQSAAAHSVMMQLIFVGIVAPNILALVSVFLLRLETLGKILIGCISLVWVLLLFKAYTELIGISKGLCNTIARRIKAEEAVEW